MEFVEGKALSEVSKAPLPIDTAVNYARQLAEAIEAAHDKGIIHRDRKPANIKVTPEGKVKVLDFGLFPFPSRLPRLFAFNRSSRAEDLPAGGG
jgi:serine/threonine protein kinase